MKRPTLVILIYILLGIISAFYLNLNHTLIIFCGTFLFAIFYFIKRKSIIFIIFSLFFILSYHLTTKSILNNNTQIISDSNSFYIEAEVVEKHKTYEDSYKYIISSNLIKNNKNTYTNKINMYLYTPVILENGEIISFNSTLNSPKKKSNFSDFNEKLYMNINNIKYKTSSETINIIGKNNGFLFSIKNLSLKVDNLIYQIFEPDVAQIISVMLVGVENIDVDTYDLYQKSGIVHILSISGLHISILSLIIMFLTKPLGNWLSNTLTLLFLIFYLILTGFNISCIRATLMMAVFVGSKFLGVKYDLISSTAFVCAILLLINPYYIYDIGFQYSFASVFAIGNSNELIKNAKIENKTLKLFIFSFIVSFAIKPITAYHFYYINLIDMFLNIIVVFLSDFIIPLALLTIFVGYFNLTLGQIIASIPSDLIEIIELLSELSLKIPTSFIITGTLSIIVLVIIYFIIIGSLNVFKYKKICIPILIIALVSYGINLRLDYNNYYLKFMNLGNGECTIIKDKNKAYLIDCGGNKEYNYQRYVLNELKYSGISEINSIFITNTDKNHIGLITSLIEEIKINDIYLPTNFIINDELLDLTMYCDNYNININTINYGFKYNINDNIKLECIYLDYSPIKVKDSSAMYALNVYNTRFLFAGDFYTKKLDDISENMSDIVDLKSDVLKLPNHGYVSSLSEKFLTLTSPKLAINFVSNYKEIEYPPKETKELFQKHNIPLLNTNEYGAILFKINKNGYEYKNFYSKYQK